MAAIAKTQKTDTPKLIALGVMIAIIAILLVFQLNSFMNPTTADAPAPAPTTPAAATTTTGGTTGAALTPTGEVVVADSPVGPAVDPFRRVLRRRDEPLTQPVEPPSEPVPSQLSGMEGTIKLPGVGTGTTGTETRPVEVKDPTEATYVKPILSGVLLGKRPVAMIEIGDKTFVLAVGESLPGGYKVVAIRETSAVIAKGKERITINLDDPRPTDRPEEEKTPE